MLHCNGLQLWAVANHTGEPTYDALLAFNNNNHNWTDLAVT